MVAGKYSLFVDTSGWIEVFRRNMSPDRSARDLLADAMKKRCPIITTNYVISEFIGRGGKACGLNRKSLLEAVEKILRFPNIEVVHIGEESHTLAIVFLRERLDKDWSLVDATSFNVMSQRGIREVLATDSDFVQAGFIKLL